MKKKSIIQTWQRARKRPADKKAKSCAYKTRKIHNTTPINHKTFKRQLKAPDVILPSLRTRRAQQSYTALPKRLQNGNLAS